MNDVKQSALARQARATALVQVNEIFKRIQMRVERVEADMVGILQDVVQLGLNLQEAAGTKQLEMFTYDGLKADLVPGLNFRLARAAVQLCNRYGPTAHLSIAQANEAWPQLALAIGVVEGAPRAPQLPQHRTNPDIWLGKIFCDLRNQFEKLLPEPMEQWPVERLDAFVFNTKKLHDDHEAAERLLREKKVVLEV